MKKPKNSDCKKFFTAILSKKKESATRKKKRKRKKIQCFSFFFFCFLQKFIFCSVVSLRIWLLLNIKKLLLYIKTKRKMAKQQQKKKTTLSVKPYLTLFTFFVKKSQKKKLREESLIFLFSPFPLLQMVYNQKDRFKNLCSIHRTHTHCRSSPNRSFVPLVFFSHFLWREHEVPFAVHRFASICSTN